MAGRFRFLIVLTGLASGLLGTGLARADASVEPSLATATPRVVRLLDALAYARTHQPQVQAALRRIDLREAEAAVSRARWLPTVGATAQLLAATANNTTASYVSAGVLDLPRIGSTRAVSTSNFRPYPSTLVGLGVNQELYDFGRIAAQTAAADALIEAGRQRARAVELDVTFDVEEAYFSVLAAHAILAAASGAYERSLSHRDLANAGVKAGLRPPIELTRAEADLAKFDVGRAQARGSLAIAQSVYAAATGVEDEALDVPEQPPAQVDVPALAEAMQRAVTRDPGLLELFARLRAKEEQTRAVAAELRPDLSLTATLSGRAGGATPSGNGRLPTGDGFLPDVVNWDVGVVLVWPLFDGTVDAREQASRADEQLQRSEIAEQRHELVSGIRDAYLALDVARAALPGLVRATTAAQANYAQAEARFGAGLGTSVELADAENVRTQAEMQLALGHFALARARATFGRMIAEGT